MIDIQYNDPFFDLAWNQHVSVDVASKEIMEGAKTVLTNHIILEHVLKLDNIEEHERRAVHAPTMKVNEPHVQQF